MVYILGFVTILNVKEFALEGPETSGPPGL